LFSYDKIFWDFKYDELLSLLSFLKPENSNVYVGGLYNDKRIYNESYYKNISNQNDNNKPFEKHNITWIYTKNM